MARMIDADELLKKASMVTLQSGKRIRVLFKRNILEAPTVKAEKYLEDKNIWDVTPSDFSFCKMCRRAIDPRNDNFCRGCGKKIKK